MKIATSNEELVTRVENKEFKKIKDFKDLKVWQEGHNIAVKIYKSTRNFPKDEMYGLVSQMKRSVVSITANVAEGFGRYHFKEKIQFYYIARGSASELESEIMIAKDVGYMSQDEANSLKDSIVEIRKMLNGLIRSAQKKV